MKTLGGTVFCYNAISQDYCLAETVACLKELCDQVIVLDAGSTDGSDHLVRSFADEKTTVVCLPNSDWEMQHGREKLNYFQNKAKEYLTTDFHFVLQADEICHEDCFPSIRRAMETNQEGFIVTRHNLWGSSKTMLAVSEDRQPCSRAVIRLAKLKYNSVGDGESLGVDQVNFDYLYRIQLFHVGFIRKRDAMKRKVRYIQESVFEIDYDKRIDEDEVFNPERYFGPEDLIQFHTPLPKFIKKWAEERDVKPKRKPIIFDCTLFFGGRAEFALLDTRIAELSEFNVYHVIVEAPVTFSGKPKKCELHDMIINDHNSQYRRDYIIPLLYPGHNTVYFDGLKEVPLTDPWIMERGQRNFLKTYLDEYAQDGDIVIITDVDEIPLAETVRTFMEKKPASMARMLMDKYGCFLNLREGIQSWSSARIMTWEYLKDKTPDEVRNSGYPATIHNAGAHFSWLGGVEQMMTKFKSFSHQEADVQKHADVFELDRKLKAGESLWGNDLWEVVPIDERFPRYIREHQEELSFLIKR